MLLVYPIKFKEINVLHERYGFNMVRTLQRKT